MLVPEMLIADEKDAITATDQLLKEVLHDQSWMKPLERVKMIDSIQSGIWIEPSGVMFPVPKACRLYVVARRLHDAAKTGLDVFREPGRTIWCARIRDLTLSGCRYPWFLASILGLFAPIFPEHPLAKEQEKTMMFRLILRTLEHWDEFVRTEFNMGALTWTVQFRFILRAFAMSEAEIIKLREWDAGCSQRIYDTLIRLQKEFADRPEYHVEIPEWD